MKQVKALLSRLCLLVKYWFMAHFSEFSPENMKKLLDLDPKGYILRIYIRRNRYYISGEIFDRLLDMECGEKMLRLYLENPVHPFCISNEKIFQIKDLARLLEEHNSMRLSEDLEKKMVEREADYGLLRSYIGSKRYHRWFRRKAETMLMDGDENLIRQYIGNKEPTCLRRLQEDSYIRLLQRPNNEALFDFCLFKGEFPSYEELRVMLKQPNADKLLMIYFGRNRYLPPSETIHMLSIPNNRDLLYLQMKYARIGYEAQLALFNSDDRQFFLDEYLSTGNRLSDEVQVKLFELPNANILLKRYIKNAGGEALSDEAAAKLFELIDPEPLVVCFLKNGGVFQSKEQLKALKMSRYNMSELLIGQKLCDLALMMIMSEYRGEELFDAYRKHFPISEGIRKIAIQKGWM